MSKKEKEKRKISTYFDRILFFTLEKFVGICNADILFQSDEFYNDVKNDVIKNVDNIDEALKQTTIVDIQIAIGKIIKSKYNLK